MRRFDSSASEPYSRSQYLPHTRNSASCLLFRVYLFRRLAANCGILSLYEQRRFHLAEIESRKHRGEAKFSSAGDCAITL